MLKVLLLKYQEVNMIPVIDFQSKTVLEEIREAYTTVGFAVFQHALSDKDQSTMKSWWNLMQGFFEQDQETKNKYSYQAENNLGYSIVGAENVDPTAPKDMKESFNYNNSRMPQELWPTSINRFKATALESIAIADKLTLKILEKFDTILDSGNTLVNAHTQMYNTTRVIHYPAMKPTEDNMLRIGEHSDYGTITLLWDINGVPGLEVQDIHGNWHHVPYVWNGVVVNIGDLLQRWTNDYFKSTKHRVNNDYCHVPRFSMPHFVDPTQGTIVKNLTTQPDKYAPIESKEYLMWRLAQSY
jgi:isopenicillin N synthase-like dioxygenase